MTRNWNTYAISGDFQPVSSRDTHKPITKILWHSKKYIRPTHGYRCFYLTIRWERGKRKQVSVKLASSVVAFLERD